VAAREALCEGILGLDLVPAQAGHAWPPAPPGSLVDVHLPDGLVRQYSVHGPTADGRGYRIAVQREAAGRGGSAWIHEKLARGTTLAISEPRDAFRLVEAPRYRFIAGGIGITPILALMRAVLARGRPAELHFGTRAAERTPFRDLLAGAPFAGRVHLVHDGGDPRRGLDLAAAVGPFDGEAALYCCGPPMLMAAVGAMAHAQRWPDAHVHFESFARSEPLGGPAANRAFRIRIASTGEVLEVGPGDTVLGVLRENGHYLDSSCEQGLCATCRVGVLQGIVDHRDQVLGALERESHSAMTTCCSRAISEELVLDL
jgi:vanillate O-demethylase ferredoxin subunit